MNELALFAGAGGGILGGKLLGWRTICAVEYEPYPASVLVARQNDGLLPPFPIWDDVRTFDGRPWRGIVDVISGGFPCQDISTAGKGAGIDGERSGLWGEMARIIGEVRPRYVLVENSPVLTSRGLGRVLGDLASMGFDAEWGVLGADDVGAPHIRKRIWIVAYADSDRGRQEQIGELGGEDPAESGHDGKKEPVADGSEKVSDANEIRQQQRTNESRWKSNIKGDGLRYNGSEQPSNTARSTWWRSEPNVGRVANGVAARVDRLKAIGNGQVPAVAAAAWKILSK